MVMGLNSPIEIDRRPLMEALLDNIAFVLFVAAQLLAVVAVPAMRFDNGISEPRPQRHRPVGRSPSPADL